jgi:hypothetical protein
VPLVRALVKGKVWQKPKPLSPEERADYGASIPTNANLNVLSIAPREEPTATTS